MHLSIVHKENIEVKQEPSCDIFKKEIEEPEKVALQCEYCQRAFSNKKSLKRHVASVHERKKQFQCENCDMAFSTRNNLNKHVS